MIAATLLVAGIASVAIAERPLATATERAGGTECANASDPVRRVSSGALRKSVLCLLSKQRRRHARKPLSRSSRLQSAAQKHAQVMVESDCLSHQCPGEPDLERRVRRSGYLQGATSWRFAENTGCGLNADAMVKNWMASTYHRINILDKQFNDVGVGVVDRGVEDRCGDGYGTFALVLGYRKPL